MSDGPTMPPGFRLQDGCRNCAFVYVHSCGSHTEYTCMRAPPFPWAVERGYDLTESVCHPGTSESRICDEWRKKP
jgi:hypothetical protein